MKLFRLAIVGLGCLIAVGSVAVYLLFSTPREASDPERASSEQSLSMQTSSADVGDGDVNATAPLQGSQVETGHTALMWGLIFLLSVSLAVNIYVFRARLIRIGQTSVLVPDIWGKKLAENTSGIIALREVVMTSSHKTSEETALQSSAIKELREILVDFHEAVSRRDEVIKRYENGYESTIFRRFVRPFVDLAVSLEIENAKRGGADPLLSSIQDALEEALANANVERLSPEVGADFREYGGLVVDRPKVQTTDQPDQDYKIVSVERAAYVFADGSRPHPITPAQITIFRFRS